MTYEHEHWGDRMQRQLDADTASTPRVKRLRATIADIERKHGKAPASAPKPTPHEPGPKTRNAMQLAEALRRASRGDIGQASATGAHKLPRYVVPA